MASVIIKNSINNNGLGNTLFQLAAAKAVSLRDGVEMTSTIPPGYNEYKDNILRNIKISESIQNNIYKEQSFEYNEIPPNVSLDGYFQSEQYFYDYGGFIYDMLSPTKEIEDYIDNKYGNILFNSLGIHIRRGDYIKYPTMHPVCNMEYYSKAIGLLADKKAYSNYIIFSDDIDWCKDNFSSEFHFIKGEKDYIDMYTMSMCSDNVIANSTFSWWAAWLNRNSDKRVVAPMAWFGKDKKLNTNDLIPKEWIKI